LAIAPAQVLCEYRVPEYPVDDKPVHSNADCAVRNEIAAPPVSRRARSASEPVSSVVNKDDSDSVISGHHPELPFADLRDLDGS